jgi:multiple antibiotic resistance protein
MSDSVASLPVRELPLNPSPELFALFFGSFTTLLAVINPFEVLPIFLTLTGDKDPAARRRIAFRACFYTLLLSLIFLFFGAAVLKLFGVSLPMVRIAGGIVLTKIGFQLFLPSGSGGNIFSNADPNANIAFMPLAMPLMFGPGVIATVLGMMATIKASAEEVIAYAAILAAASLAVAVTFLCLAYAGHLVRWLGPLGINATTRIVGFFVAAMGASLVFNGVMAAIDEHGVRVVL